jgi:CheY-like chemotaxis protein
MPSDPILIVDDNPVNLKLTMVLLESEGYAVKTAGDAEEALTLVTIFRPRLILMDLQLPGMDGLELTKRIKADPMTKETIVIALTAYAMKGDKEKALNSGCDGYMTKPIDTRSFLPTIASYLR